MVAPALARELLPLLGARGRAGLSPALEQLLQLLPAALFLCDIRGVVTFFNDRAAAFWGLDSLQAAATRSPTAAGHGFPAAGQEELLFAALRDGTPRRGVELVIGQAGQAPREVSLTLEPLRDETGAVCGAIALAQDITAQKRRERFATLLDRLSATVAPLSGEAEIVRAATQLVGEGLEVGRCGFIEADRARDELRIAEGWTRSGVTSLAGTYPMGRFVPAEAAQAIAAGAIVVPDVAAHPLTAARAAAFQALGVGAFVACPCAQALPEPFVLAVATGEPRAWAADEVAWLEQAVARVWPLVERARAEAARRDADLRLRLATQNGKVGLWDWDIARNRVAWTDSLYAIHGVTREAFDGTAEGFARLVHPEDRAPVARAIQSSLEHGLPYELEFRAVKPGGATVWLFTNAVVVREGGRPRRMIGATFDITARKLTELALRESEGRFRALASHAPVGIFLTDSEGDCVFVNESWRAMAGLTLEQARGQGWLAAVHPEDRARLHAAWQAALRRHEPFALELRFQRPDGVVTWLAASAVEFRSGNAPAGLVGTVVDITERKAAEEALRESEKRFRTLASHAPVGIFLTAPDGATLFVNEFWCALTGVTLADAQGDGWLEAIHPEDRARVLAGWEEAVRRGAASTAEYRFRRADGAVIWVQGHAVQLHDGTGRPLGYIGTIADVTQRKAAEKKLRAQEAQLRFIADHAPVSLAHCSRDGRYLFVNRRNAERMALPIERIAGRPLREVMGEAAARAIQPYIDRVLTGEPVTFELEVPYRTIGTRYMRCSYEPDIDEAGHVRGWLAVLDDITDRRAMEHALRESEERFRQLADSMPQIVWTAGPDGMIDYYNRRWYDYAAPPTGGNHNESFLACVAPEDRERRRDVWAACVRTGAPFQIEYRLRRADGELRWYLGRALPVRDGAGKILRWFGTCTDIHDWKLVQDELRRAQEQLEQHAAELERRVAERTASLREAIAQMEEFSYSVSHDLRAPLRAMNAYAGALVEDYGPQLDDTARGYLERIQRSSRRMERLTHDVLTYSRIARTEVHLVSLPLAPLLHDLVLHYAELHAPATRVELVEPLEPVRGQEVLLGQCLGNLLTNAAKFVAPGVAPHIRVRTELRGTDRVRVWIEDNGIGIDPRQQARLFRVFERVPTKHGYEGTGIGLAIVRKAVEKMSGACGVESDGRTGSRFWIELGRG